MGHFDRSSRHSASQDEPSTDNTTSNHESGYMGHSTGCRANESPELSVNNDLMIQENMMFVLEPIFGVPGVTGAKLEDVVWVTASSVEHLALADLEPWKRQKVSYQDRSSC